MPAPQEQMGYTRNRALGQSEVKPSANIAEHLRRGRGNGNRQSPRVPTLRIGALEALELRRVETRPRLVFGIMGFNTFPGFMYPI